MVKPGTRQGTKQGGLEPYAIGTIDPVRFARDAGHLEGTVSATSLPRVAEELFDQQGTVAYSLDGMTTTKGDSALRIELTIELALACNRCMERLPLKSNVARTLVFSQDLSEFDAVDNEDDDVDQVPLVARLDVLDLIDQEVMLTLPIAPRHAEGACAALIDYEPDAQSASPFSVLSKLKQT